MPYVDLYLRKSKIVRNADARELTTIVTQEARGREWAERNGYTVREVWVDNLSAWTDIRRPQFDKALSAVLAGDVSALWCAFLDRFSRKGIDDIGPILGKARVVFDYERLDSSVERDRRWIIDQAERVREFSSTLSFNVRSTKSTQRSQGKWLGRPPYGFDIDGPFTRKLVHNADWPTVERIITALANGVSQRGVCRIVLNSEGILSPKGGTWQVVSIAMILHSPVYEGWQTVRENGRRVAFRDAEGNRVSVLAEGVTPIDAQLLAKARGSSGSAWVTNGSEHLLTGVNRCPGCGGPSACTGRSYVCSNHITGKPCPAPTNVLRTNLEEHVRDAWVARLSGADDDDPLLIAVAKRYGLLRRPGSAEAVQEAAAALEAAQRGVQRLVDGMAAGHYDPPFDVHLRQLQREARAALDAAQARADEVAPRVVDITVLRDPETALNAWNVADPAFRRDLVRLAIKQITVTKGDIGRRFVGAERVKITWHGDDE